MGESEGSSINKNESPQLQSLLDPVPEELSPVVEKESDTQSTISISQEPNQLAISTLDDQKVADDHAGNKETGDHDDKKDAKGSTDRDAGLAKIVAEKRLALIKAWEESEKTKAENRAYKKQSSVGLWEESKKSSIEAQLKKFEENLERKKVEYISKMKNELAEIHQYAEEKRAIVRATRCTRAPAYAGSGKGSHHLVYCTQPYPVLHKRLFPGLEPVTFQSHDNNFTSCAKVTPQKRAIVEAQKREECLELEETAAKFRSRGVAPKKLFACFSA